MERENLMRDREQEQEQGRPTRLTPLPSLDFDRALALAHAPSSATPVMRARRLQPPLAALFFLAALFLAFNSSAAERVFDFGAWVDAKPPADFRSAVSGKGKPGEWKVLMDEVPSLLPPLSPGVPENSRRPVLAQLSQDTEDERFPLLIYEKEAFADFKLTTRFKTVGGSVERMAGIVFRLQSETNYYVLRASSIGNTFRFYKVVDGQRGTIIGPEIPIPSGVWHELAVECKGNQISCFLNGKQAIPAISDSTFTSGKIGFWTKSDSVSYFSETRIAYTPREPAIQSVVRETLETYPRLLGLKVFMLSEDKTTARVVASKEPSDLGQAGEKPEIDVITQGATYYGKGKSSVAVTMPLRDRNGDIVAAVRVLMKSFPGQTEENAVVRAAPIVKQMQARIHSRQELVE